ncbi:centriolin isoform X2 [Centrocercus urophasianus]|uniref:centriolin isoform X2 n=1 Tax=Centrocercus urophasianus TaxID=9002 RepID=UPI001C648066|nr:centriolin isoform X2 [Centrocercus urophasianus]
MKKSYLKKELCGKSQMSAFRTPTPMSSVGSGTRSSSPLSQQASPPAHKSRAWQNQQLDTTANVEAAFESKFYEDENGVSPGVRYITEPLIKSLSKQENLAYISSLNLSSPKDGDKKFKYIENLERCSKLERLNLSNNQIEKIEKLDKLLKLRELNLSYNKISKIEGMEHLRNLQKMNLAGNEIEHIPVWVGKKLRSLRILNLKQNKVSSLHEVAKLKPLQDLTSLFLAGNPVASLPHYRLYVIFHLRALENLDGQPVTNRDRQEALQRFDLEEIEKLERELENAIQEMENLKLNQSKVLEQLHHQDEVNKSLKEKTLQQKQSCEDLQRDVDTKNELLKQKTMELTRACQKQYELEQELAFYKIDAKFEPLNYFPSEDVELDSVPGESPYIGKARYKRNMFITEGYIASKAQQMGTGKMQSDKNDLCMKSQLEPQFQTLDEQLESKEKKIHSAQRRLEELQSAIGKAEQQVLEVTGELQQLEGALAQKKVSQANREDLEQQLSKKIQILHQLREEALALEKQMENQKREIGKKQKELEDLKSSLAAVNSKDPRHAHMRAQKASKEQQIEVMNKQYKQLEIRLDEMLSRIAKETEEIKDLEQQLTDGQIATNEALKRDLESIIIGLQEYLEGVKHQAKQANDECKELQKDKESLLQRLADLEDERNSLKIVTMDAENMRKEIAVLEGLLQEQQEINESLRGGQGQLSAYEAELEAQLRDRDTETNRQKEELERLKQLSQMELSALQAELEKERQALENALSKAQLAEEKEQENYKLLSQFKQLQGDNNLLKQQLKDLQNQLSHAVGNLMHPEEVLARINELKQKLRTGAGEIKCHNSADVLGKSLANLQKEFNSILADTQREKEKAWERQRQLQEEMVSQQEKLEDIQEKYRQVKSENRQNKNKVHQLENEIQLLREKIRSMEEIQGLADQQLQEADEEKEAILAQLEDLEKRKKIEDARAQMQFADLDKELKELKRAIITSDKLAAAELCIAKNQLQALHGTVLKINQERAEEFEEAEEFCVEAARATRDLARAEAEIELLQQLLKQKEEQLQHETGKAGEKTALSSQKLEIDELNDTVEQQKAEIERLRWLLDDTGAGNKDEIDNLQDEIAALRNALSCQKGYVTSIADPVKRRGYWYYVPPSQASTPASHSTKDSGVGLQCPGTSPPRKGCSQVRKEDLPRSRGCWVYSPVRNRWYKTNPNKAGRAEEDGEGNVEAHAHKDLPFVPPPGAAIYTLLPAGAPPPQGAVASSPPPAAADGGSTAPGSVPYGLPPVGAQVVYGILPPNFTVPLVPFGGLHCNVPKHHDLESEVSRLEDTVRHLRSRKYRDKWSEAAGHKCKNEMEELRQNMEDLLHEREELEREVAELHRAAQTRNKRKDFVEGYTESLMAELQLEKSLKHHEDIAEEIECIEKTLLKRRAELREADRLLTEAEMELESTRGKTKDTIQKYNRAKQHLLHTETEAEELERRAQEMATELVKADQQLRSLQADTQDLEQRKKEQEGVLKEINKVVSARDSEFQSLNQKIEMLTGSLQKLQGDIQVAEGNEEHHLQMLREAENILQVKKTELERLKNQVTAQQQELLFVEQQLRQRKEQLRVLQDCISQKKGDLKEALRDGETEAKEKQRQIKEIRLLLEDLNAERRELGVQIEEKRAQLSVIRKDIGKEEENLQIILGQINKHKIELKHVLEMLEIENNELQGLKLQHDQKVNELEKTQVAVLEEKLKLENIQRLFQCQQGEVDWQQQQLQKDRQESEHLVSQMRALQSNIESLNKEKQKLEEDCQSLERKLSQTRRDLSAAEGGIGAASSKVERMELEIESLQQEADVLNEQKKSLRGEMAAVQKDLQEKKNELEMLKGELSESRQQLQLAEQNLKDNTKHQEELLKEQATLKEDILKCVRKCKDCQERQKKRENHLQQLQKEIEEKETILAKQEAILYKLKQNSEHEGKKLEENTAKLKEQKQLLEKELRDQREKLEEAVAKVRLTEENNRKLEKEASQLAALEETVRKSKHQVSEKELQVQQKNREIQSLQKELKVSKSEVNHLQGQLAAERKRAEKRICSLKEAMKMQRTQFERKLHEQKHANNCLQSDIAAAEQVAQSNHERTKHLMKELGQIQQNYVDLQNQVKTQEDLEKRQREIEDTATLLKSEVEDSIKTRFKSSSPSPPELLEDLEAFSAVNRSMQCESDDLEEMFSFADADKRLFSLERKLDFSQIFIMDEQWRGEALREKLQHHEDRLKVDVLIRGKQQTQGTLHSLKRQVDALDDLVSSTSSDSLFLAESSSGLLSLRDALNVTKTQAALTGHTHFPSSSAGVPAGAQTWHSCS